MNDNKQIYDVRYMFVACLLGIWCTNVTVTCMSIGSEYTGQFKWPGVRYSQTAYELLCTTVSHTTMQSSEPLAITD